MLSYFFPYQLFIEQKDEVYPRPFFMPLCLFDAVDERLHTSGALFLHALGDVTVHIQRKGRCSVAEISLHRFHRAVREWTLSVQKNQPLIKLLPDQKILIYFSSPITLFHNLLSKDHLSALYFFIV